MPAEKVHPSLHLRILRKPLRLAYAPMAQRRHFEESKKGVLTTRSQWHPCCQAFYGEGPAHGAGYSVLRGSFLLSLMTNLTVDDSHEFSQTGPQSYLWRPLCGYFRSCTE